MIINPEKISWTKPQGFVVLEGLNGAGKSTLQRALADLAKSHNLNTLLTHEPGAGSFGTKVRELVLSTSSSEAITPNAELFLFAADRAQHVEKIIRPALEQGNLVICDRYIYSTLAFQGAGRGLDAKMIEQVCQIATAGLVPDLVILLDIDPAHGLSRTKSRAAKNNNLELEDRFEQEELNFHQRLRTCFLELAKTRPEKFIVIDSSQEKDQVLEKARAAFEALCKAL